MFMVAEALGLRIGEVESMPVSEYEEWIGYFTLKGRYEKWRQERQRLKLPLDGFFLSKQEPSANRKDD